MNQSKKSILFYRIQVSLVDDLLTFLKERSKQHQKKIFLIFYEEKSRIFEILNKFPFYLLIFTLVPSAQLEIRS